MVHPTPDAPTHDLVSKYIDAFIDNARFLSGDGAILFLVSLFPKNTAFPAVLAKVCIINDLYATGIAATYDMAEHIVTLDVDNALSLAETADVDRIAYLGR